mmetsp:Transcript_118528/g.215576  ORF Transcript_118528/g.215576 Transcript_118528/m.215576 type:complete len:423 (-) Transcript_118528:52-1320(-)
MIRIVLVLAYWACAGCGRHVQTSKEQLQRSPTARGQDSRSTANPFKTLAGLLLSFNQASTFNPPDLGMLPSDQSTATLNSRRVPAVRQQFGFEIPKSGRQQTREAWERADVYRPGEKNWFTRDQKDLLELHTKLAPQFDELSEKDPPGIPGAGNKTSLMSTLLKSLTTGDLALTLCSPEPPVLKQLRDWLIKRLTMPQAVRGLPEEQGRVLSTVAKALDARKILDLGTYTGYSSIAMALATASDSRVICCEPEDKFAKLAEEWWKKAGCESKMEMHGVKAQQLMNRMLDRGEAGTVDMIFCDVGDREQYAEIHELAMQLLRVGGAVVYYDTLWPADGVLEHGYYPAMRQFNEKLATDPRVLASLVPLSYGITICSKVMSVDGPQLSDARDAADEGSPELMQSLLLERRAKVLAELDAMPAVA